MMSVIVQSLGISTEVLLIFAFLPLSRVEKKRLPFLPVFMAAITAVTMLGTQSSFYLIVGMVALRLVIFALFILFYFRFDLRHSIYLAMMYFLLTQPARRIVTASLSYFLQHGLDEAVRASQITENMKIAAAYAIAGLVSDEELSADYILPQAFDPRVKDAVSRAAAEAARKDGVARI